MRTYIFHIALLGLLACKNQEQPDEILPPNDSVMSIITSDPSSIVISKQRPIIAGTLQQDLLPSSSLTGFSERDPERDITVSVLTGGRIEKVYVSAEGSKVEKGQKLFEYYSPELNTLQEQFILARASGDAELAGKIATRLMLLAFPGSMLKELPGRTEPFPTIPHYSPASGYIFTPAAKASGAVMEDNISTGSMSMESTAPSNAVSSATQSGRLPLSEEYFNSGDNLYMINDLSELWISFYLPPGREVTPGRSLTVSNNGATYSAEVKSAEPVIREGSEFVSVRAVISNKDLNIKTGEVFSIEMEKQQAASDLRVPSASVLDLGTRQIVWKVRQADTNGVYVYVATEISAVPAGSGVMQITSGITAGDRIAPAAGFMTDVQSLIHPKNEK